MGRASSIRNSRIRIFAAMLAIFEPTPSNARKRLATAIPLLPVAQIRAASPSYLWAMNRMAAGSNLFTLVASGCPDVSSTEDHTLSGSSANVSNSKSPAASRIAPGILHAMSACARRSAMHPRTNACG